MKQIDGISNDSQADWERLSTNAHFVLSEVDLIFKKFLDLVGTSEESIEGKLKKEIRSSHEIKIFRATADEIQAEIRKINIYTQFVDYEKKANYLAKYMSWAATAGVGSEFTSRFAARVSKVESELAKFTSNTEVDSKLAERAKKTFEEVRLAYFKYSPYGKLEKLSHANRNRIYDEREAAIKDSRARKDSDVLRGQVEEELAKTAHLF